MFDLNYEKLKWKNLNLLCIPVKRHFVNVCEQDGQKNGLVIKNHITRKLLLNGEGSVTSLLYCLV
jgi:hypothetical protein